MTLEFSFSVAVRLTYTLSNQSCTVSLVSLFFFYKKSWCLVRAHVAGSDTFVLTLVLASYRSGRAGKGVLTGILGGGVPPGFPNQHVLDPKIGIFRPRFQTWHLKSIPVFRPGVFRNYISLFRFMIRAPTKRFLKIHFEFARIWKWNEKYVHAFPCSLENHTRIQTEIGEVSTFRLGGGVIQTLR